VTPSSPASALYQSTAHWPAPAPRSMATPLSSCGACVPITPVGQKSTRPSRLSLPRRSGRLGRSAADASTGRGSAVALGRPPAFASSGGAGVLNGPARTLASRPQQQSRGCWPRRSLACGSASGSALQPSGYAAGAKPEPRWRPLRRWLSPKGRLSMGLTAAAGLGGRPPVPWAVVVLRCEAAGNAIVREPAVAAARVRELAAAGEVPCAGVRCCWCLSSTCGRQSSGAYGAAGPRPAWAARASAQQASTALMRSRRRSIRRLGRAGRGTGRRL
jgi:hypothetical protein